LIPKELKAESGNAPLGFVMLAPVVLGLFLAVLQINQLVFKQVVLNSTASESFAEVTRSSIPGAMEQWQESMFQSDYGISTREKEFSTVILNILSVRYSFELPFVGLKTFQIQSESVSE
jgi:hypothetical protein